jgi:hypothetical protein
VPERYHAIANVGAVEGSPQNPGRNLISRFKVLITFYGVTKKIL